MPTMIVNPKNRDEPVLGYSFALEIRGEVKGWFTECSGLGLQREVKAQPEGGVNDYVHQLPGRVKQNNITLKHGLIGNELWDWFEQGLYDGKVDRRDISIILYSGDMKQKKSWDVTSAYPIKWTGPSLDSSKSDVIVETVELVHHGLKMNDWADA